MWKCCYVQCHIDQLDWVWYLLKIVIQKVVFKKIQFGSLSEILPNVGNSDDCKWGRGNIATKSGHTCQICDKFYAFLTDELVPKYNSPNSKMIWW